MRQLFIDSRDRVNDGGTSADFRILLPQTLVLENTQQLRVDHFRLPITIGTINSSNDQVLCVKHTIQIARSNYDGPSLAAALQAALTAVAGSWTVAYNINLIIIQYKPHHRSRPAGLKGRMRIDKIWERG